MNPLVECGPTGLPQLPRSTNFVKKGPWFVLSLCWFLVTILLSVFLPRVGRPDSFPISSKTIHVIKPLSLYRYSGVCFIPVRTRSYRSLLIFSPAFGFCYFLPNFVASISIQRSLFLLREVKLHGKEPDFLWLVPPNCTINSVPVYLDLLLAPIIFYLFLKNL